MTGGQLNANADQYLQANGLNVPPPLITSDPLVTGATPIEQLLRVLGLAANAGDSTDNSESVDGHAERDLKTAEAAAKFPAQDEEAATEIIGRPVVDKLAFDRLGRIGCQQRHQLTRPAMG